MCYIHTRWCVTRGMLQGVSRECAERMNCEGRYLQGCVVCYQRKSVLIASEGGGIGGGGGGIRQRGVTRRMHCLTRHDSTHLPTLPSSEETSLAYTHLGTGTLYSVTTVVSFTQSTLSCHTTREWVISCVKGCERM